MRTQFRQILARSVPWFAVGRGVIYKTGNRKMTIRRIDFDDWSFHVEEVGNEKWLKMRIYDVLTQFGPAPTHLEIIDEVLASTPGRPRTDPLP